MAQVKLPVIGEVDQKWAIAGGALFVGIVGYAWWRYRTSAADELAPAPTADELAPTGDEFAPGGQTTPGITFPPREEPDPDKLPPTSNDEWFRRGVAYMEGLAADSAHVATVLGKYLARQPVTTAEADIIRTVQGAIGRPPVGDFPIVPVGAAPTPTTPAKPGAPSGLRVVTVGRTTVVLTWSAGTGAERYEIRTVRAGQAANTGNIRTTGVRQYSVANLTPGTRWSFAVRSVNAAGTSAFGSTVTATTKK